MASYNDVVEGIQLYYEAGSDEWLAITQGIGDDITITERYDVIKDIPGVSIEVSDNGNALGYTLEHSFPSSENIASNVNSNVQNSLYNSQTSFDSGIPATSVTDPVTQETSLISGVKDSTTQSIVPAIADRVSLAVMGVAIGTKLGCFIDSAIYSANPEYWDEHFPTINPQTWASMCTTKAGQSFVRGIFGINGDTKETTMYLDERLLAYTYALFLENGGLVTVRESDVSESVYTQLPYHDNFTQPVISTSVMWGAVCDCTTNLQEHTPTWFEVKTSTSPVIAFVVTQVGYGGSSTPRTMLFMCSKKPFELYHYMDFTESGGIIERRTDVYNTKSTVLGQDIYLSTTYDTPFNSIPGASYNSYEGVEYPSTYGLSLAYILLYGTTIAHNPMPGVSEDDRASTHPKPQNVINPTTGDPVQPTDNLDDILQALKTAYPSLFDDEVEEDVPQRDGTIVKYKYIPTPYPDTEEATKPKTGDRTQDDPEIDPETDPEGAEDLIGAIVPPPTPDPPDTGSGNTPPTIPPSGTASALYTIYNPSQSELNSLGAWLWSSNFVDQLLKIFSDPMQAIIGLHKVFVSPPTGGTNNIKVGYLDSGVSANVVIGQYVDVSCGSVNLREYFGNVFDYDPYTQVSIYLPFIGIENLNVADVMRSNIEVVYHVDVLTGACLADVIVTRDGCGGTLYTYSGNCAVQYPLSMGSYMGIVSSVASVAMGAVGTVVSQGALAPFAMGAVNGVLNAKTSVKRSGGFSGNAGAMGCKTPYLIITRPQTALAMQYNEFVGYPSNTLVLLSTCSGYTECLEVHVEHSHATETELTELNGLLKGGVIF